ncbi:MAG: penicillin-binding protein 2 [Christensenellaceae bacterium]|nr:penicillin-binding protein 2 [Christensenellaceae bacterium]
MKKNRLRSNIRVLLVVFIMMFAGLVVYLGYAVTMYGERWFVTPYNPRIQNMRTTVKAGDLLDRTGRTLLTIDKEGNRNYVKDDGTRLAIAHIVGDGYGMTYGAQTMFAKYLFGFDKDTITRIVDAISGEVRVGSDVALTIDAKLCDAARDAMGKSRGAVVVMNYRTGEILASVSSPSFDPTDMKMFLEGGGESELVNRAFSGLYPPGSTFKLVTAAALIDNGREDFTANCNGSTEIGGNTIKCTGEHGKENLEDALAHSCNVYFAEAAQQLGAQKLLAEADKFLFNNDMLWNDVVMGKSVYESTEDKTQLSWSAIGQYHDLITPLHACMIAGAIANDGVMMEPKLLYSVSSSLKTTYSVTPSAAATPVSSAAAGKLKEMMIGAVKNGTGKKAALKNYTVGGKTGTAEIADGDTNAEHAWFVGFVDDDEHPLAIAVILEKAGSGGSNAAPAAKKVLTRAIDLGY